MEEAHLLYAIQNVTEPHNAFYDEHVAPGPAERITALDRQKVLQSNSQHRLELESSGKFYGKEKELQELSEINT